MANIALICEGVSEHNIIKHIVARYAGDHMLNAIQPKINQQNHTQADNGGWARVLEHCNNQEFENLFQWNDYLIIQIDTDSSHIKPYDIPHCFKDGSPKSHRRLHAEIKSRLMKQISRDVREKYIHRIFFAICHNEIECWLLPLLYSDKDSRACKTHNCIKVLNDALSKNNMKGIPDKGKNSKNAQDAYNAILKKMKKRDAIVMMARHSYGLKCLLDGLDTVRE